MYLLGNLTKGGKMVSYLLQKNKLQSGNYK